MNEDDNQIFKCDVCARPCILISPEDDMCLEKCPYNKEMCGMKAKWERKA